MREARAGWARWLWVSALVLALDLATKAWVSRHFTLGESVTVLPFFNLVLMHNTGAAFSFLAGAGGWQRWFFSGLTVAICVFLLHMLRNQHGNRRVAFAVGLVIGGALGNLWDRLTLGYVVDFLLFHAGGYAWPAFNVADSAITVGVAILVWDSVRPGGEREPVPARGDER